MPKRSKRKPSDIFYIMLCKACENLGLPEPEQEYKFHPSRQWRFDLAWQVRSAPSTDDGYVRALAVEFQGGTFARVEKDQYGNKRRVLGKHSRGAGQRNDFEKYNEAQRLGWRVILLDSSMIASQPKRVKYVDYILEMLQ